MYQVQEYGENGFAIDGVVGMDGSPSCGVDRWADGEDGRGPGALIAMLASELQRQEIDIPMKGINARKPLEAVNVVGSLIHGSSGGRA